MAEPHSTWDLISLARDQTYVPYLESRVLTTGLAGTSLNVGYCDKISNRNLQPLPSSPQLSQALEEAQMFPLEVSLL